MDKIRGDEVRHGKDIYLAAVSKDLIASLDNTFLSEDMLNRLHTHSALQPLTASAIIENYKAQGEMVFAVCLRNDDHCIGVCHLGNVAWSLRHADLMLSIVSEAHYTTAMLADVIQTVLQFSYWEANLNRIAVHCAADNDLMQQSLEQLNFTHEGTLRQHIYRNAHYIDKHIYSILQRDWSA